MKLHGGDVSGTGSEPVSGVPDAEDKTEAPAGVDEFSQLERLEEVPREAGSNESAPAETLRAEDCFQLVELVPGVVVMAWKQEVVTDQMAKVIEAVCRELLARRGPRVVCFDLSFVRELSTAALNQLVRFHNSARGVGLEPSLIVSPALREDLKQRSVDRILCLRVSVYELIGRQVKIVEGWKPAQRGRLSRLTRVWRCLSLP